MVAVDLSSLFNKLDGRCQDALQQAVGLAYSRTHYNVEIEHWLLKLLESSDSNLAPMLERHDVNTARLSRELTTALDKFRSGNTRVPAISPHMQMLAREAWLLASIEFGAEHIEPGDLLCALLTDETLGPVARGSSHELRKVSGEAIRQDLPAYRAREGADAGQEAAQEQGGPVAEPATGRASRTPALDQYTIDLTARARAGDLDPVLGREGEIRQVIDILTRRRQNNPILTGEAGVGKTAVVEGLALRIAAGDVPPAVKPVAIRTLDLALLQAGAGVRGEFENRLKSVINEVKASSQPVILFIDEAHTLIGAGGSAGQGDAANILKPPLARGELRTVAATTWAEYRKYFETDAALVRRFQVVKIGEPDDQGAVAMMRGLVSRLEGHHGVRILDEAAVEAVRLSRRYISGRQLPDKSVTLLDTACARVALAGNTTPPAIEDCQRRIESLDSAIHLLQREEATGADHARRLAEMTEEKERLTNELAGLNSRWADERGLVKQIRELRTKLEAASEPATEGQAGEAVDREQLLSELQARTEELSKLQGEAPLVPVCVDAQAVAGVVADWTGIPVGRMVTDEIQGVLDLQARMQERIVGQSHALGALAETVKVGRASLGDPRRPIGVFLFVGPSGVGKTETAITLADLLYGGEQNMTVINMSEFKEEHKVSLLMGSPPGYVGYREGGVLTEAVRRRPYSLVLLDEMEKAHPGVQDIFYQVFDKGTLRDGEGRDIDFKNTVIIMTSNAGTEAIMQLCADPETAPDPDGLAEALRPELLGTFKPAFLGRVSVVPFYPLDDSALKAIVDMQLARIGGRITDNYGARFDYAPELVESIAARCREVETGARNVDHILSRSLLPEVSGRLLSRLGANEPVTEVHAGVDDSGRFRYEIR